MKIINDLRILKALERRSNWEFDREHKYCTNNDNNAVSFVEYNGKTYRLKYFSGCFCPFCVEA